MLSDICVDRLGTFRRWVGISTLRGIDAEGIPDEVTAEPVDREFLGLHQTQFVC